MRNPSGSLFEDQEEGVRVIVWVFITTDIVTSRDDEPVKIGRKYFIYRPNMS